LNKDASNNLIDSTKRKDEVNEANKNNSLKRKSLNRQNKCAKSRKTNNQHEYLTRSNKKKTREKWN